MAKAIKSYPLSTIDGRRIWLRAQRLDTAAPFGAGPQATRAAVEHLGYVQIDTINVIERSHHHVLWSRIPEYHRADLRQAQSIDKSVFEYWTHALSYVPTRDIRFFIPAMRLHKREGHKWFSSVTAADMRKVMKLIRHGPLTIRDIDDDVLTEKQHLWASRKPSKRALQLAFYEGVLTISERVGMLKTYDLMSRHFGWDKPPTPASAREITAYLLDRALRAQGVVSLDSACHLDAPSKSAMRRLIEARVRKRELVPVALEGAAKQEHWALPETLEAVNAGTEQVHILSPFDPLIIQRKRTELFFGYGHRFEAYVPREKRLFGYFALPVLVGDEIVSAIDLKTDRQNRKVLMQKWSWVGSTAKQRGRNELKRRIEEELHRFERFQLAGQAAVAEPAAFPAVVSADGLMETMMDNDKSILGRIADTVKDIATTAADAASDALKKEEPPLKADDSAAVYMPLAAEGLVFDPLAPSVAGAPVRRKRSAVKQTAKKAARKKATGKAAKKAGKKSRATKSGKRTSGKSKRAPAKAKAAAATKKRAATKTAGKACKTDRRR